FLRRLERQFQDRCRVRFGIGVPEFQPPFALTHGDFHGPPRVPGEQETSTPLTPQRYFIETQAQLVRQSPQFVIDVQHFQSLVAASILLSVCLNSLRVMSGGGQMIAWFSRRSLGNCGSPGVFATRNPNDSIHFTSSANTKLPGRKD